MDESVNKTETPGVPDSSLFQKMAVKIMDMAQPYTEKYFGNPMFWAFVGLVVIAFNVYDSRKNKVVKP